MRNQLLVKTWGLEGIYLSYRTLKSECRYSLFKDTDLNSSLLQSELDLVTGFQRIEYRKEKRMVAL